MSPDEILARRLQNLLLRGAPMPSPGAVLRRLGAVQSQDYGPAKWSLGLRADNVDDATVEDAFARGDLLRTHVLRPTWHFVAPEDIRWMLQLTGPRVHALNSHYYRKTGLDPATVGRATKLVGAELDGGNALTRKELAAALDGTIPESPSALAYLLMHAELEGVICSGPRRGRQHTHALLDERVPPQPTLTRDAALGELVRRYFTSHGPATVKDLRWWSSLTMADIRGGLQMVGSQLDHFAVDGRTYWWAPSADPPPPAPSPVAELMQPYDELFVGYQETKGLVDPERRWGSPQAGTTIPNGVLIVDGRLAGHWKRTISADTVHFDVLSYETPDGPLSDALQVAADAQGRFLGLRATIAIKTI